MSQTNARTIPESSDVLGETLYSLRLNGLMYAKSELSAPWGIEMPAMEGKMMFHIVTQGGCWLNLNKDTQLFLKPGELVLLPQGEGHRISSSNSISCEPFFDIPISNISDRFEFMRYGGDGEKTYLTCGVLSFDHVAGSKLISQLPPVIHITEDAGGLPQQMNALIQLITAEAETLKPGGETVIAHLADIIVIQALRHWIDSAEEAKLGWLGALKDPKIGKALALIHAHPESAWTVERLAKQAGMSRSGFSARFTEVIGTSAKQYLTEWRMSLARIRIMHSPIPLIDLAEELGYRSESAFSRAYKRVFGVPPLRNSRD